MFVKIAEDINTEQIGSNYDKVTKNELIGQRGKHLTPSNKMIKLTSQ